MWLSGVSIVLLSLAAVVSSDDDLLNLINFISSREDVSICSKNASITHGFPPHICQPVTCLYAANSSKHAGMAYDISRYPFQLLSSPVDCTKCIGGLCPSDNVEVSFIMAVHGNEVLAIQSLLQLFRTSNEADGVEFIVVDDASPDPVPLMMEAVNEIREIFGLKALFMRLEENAGYGMANHAGILRSTGKYIALVNTDMFPARGWLAALLWTHKHFTHAGVTGPMFVGHGNRVTEAGGFVLDSGQAGNYGRGLDPSDETLAYARFVDYISAACIIMEKWLYLTVGGFTADYGKGYYEDTDLCMKVRSMGFRVIYQPAAVVFHEEGHSLSKLKEGLMVKNKQIFLSTWRPYLALLTPVLRVASSQQYHTRCLWIDDIVPEPDHDSGSIRTMALLDALVQDGVHVTFQPTAPRVRSYMIKTRMHGVQVHYQYMLESILKPDRLCGYDFVVVARRDVFRLVKNSLYACQDLVIIYDTVDIHFLREARMLHADKNTSRGGFDEVIQWLDNAPEAIHARKVRDIELELLGNSSAIIVVSEVEVKLLNHYMPAAKVFLVSNIHTIHKTLNSCENRKGLLFVGNMNHQPNMEGLRWFLEEVLPFITVDVDVVNIVGSNDGTALRKWLNKANIRNVKFHGSLSDEQLHGMYNSVRYSLAPLLAGAGVKGKVNQAMALGVPIVATSIAVEGMHVMNMTDAVVAPLEPAVFASLISSVYDDCNVWRGLQEHAYLNIETYFSPGLARSQMLAALISTYTEQRS
mmetsp:Transcript_21118/g.35983  ORF Transcript_21118/g.35983 Transcript_21118/m.35983 type:complete len:753 (+) Transcript_21118:1716-3974(+)